MNNQPIGILDSGVGGLSIWREIINQLPYESIVYIADSKNCPYGPKSKEQIYKLSKRLVKFLVDKKVKLIVIACNTITVTCLGKLRNDFPAIPIVGTVPVVKTAVEKSKNKRIGILSTTRTAGSSYQKKLITTFAKGYKILNLGNDELVSLVENGEIKSKRLEGVLEKEISKFTDFDIDTLVLGCTHFPFLKDKMQKFLDEKVLILDSSGAIARQVKRVMDNNGALAQINAPSYNFFTTSDIDGFKNAINILFEDSIKSKFNHISSISI